MQENKGARWTEEEDNKLYQECVDKISLEEICAKHKRNSGGIKSRKLLLADKLINSGRDRQEIYTIFSTNEDEIYYYLNRKNKPKNTEKISDIQPVGINETNIRTELDNISKKCAKLKKKYKELETKINILRDHCGIKNETVNISTSSLERFLKSDLVTLDPKLYCRQKVFVAALNDYCKKNGLLSSKWTNQFYAGPFLDFGLKMDNNARKRYPNTHGSKSYTETFIIGVDIKNTDENFCDESSDSE